MRTLSAGKESAVTHHFLLVVKHGDETQKVSLTCRWDQAWKRTEDESLFARTTYVVWEVRLVCLDMKE
jgi:hypothetical protein